MRSLRATLLDFFILKKKDKKKGLNFSMVTIMERYVWRNDDDADTLIQFRHVSNNEQRDIRASIYLFRFPECDTLETTSDT